MKQNINAILSAILVVVWMIVIFCFSAMPADESNSKSLNIINKAVEKFEAKSGETINTTSEQDGLEEPTSNKESQEQKVKNAATQGKATKQKEKTILINKLNKLLRKFAHASVYFILYILVLNLIYQIKGEYKITYCMLAIGICFLYACTDELHQLFVEGRTALFSDVIIDTIGATIACLIVELFYKIVKKCIKIDTKTKRK